MLDDGALNCAATVLPPARNSVAARAPAGASHGDPRKAHIWIAGAEHIRKQMVHDPHPPSRRAACDGGPATCPAGPPRECPRWGDASAPRGYAKSRAPMFCHEAPVRRSPGADHTLSTLHERLPPTQLPSTAVRPCAALDCAEAFRINCTRRDFSPGAQQRLVGLATPLHRRTLRRSPRAPHAAGAPHRAVASARDMTSAQAVLHRSMPRRRWWP